MNFVSKILFIILLSLFTTNSSASELYEVSLAKFPLKKTERISGIEIKLKSGRIYSMSQFPMGWNVVVNNDPSWMTSFKGGIAVGAAALEQKDKIMLDHFLVIEKLTDQIISKDVPFSVEVDVFLVDFSNDKERVIHAGKEMFEVRKIEGAKNKSRER